MSYQVCIKSNSSLRNNTDDGAVDIVTAGENGDLEDTYINIEDGQSLLIASERYRHKTIPVGCRGGGCGVCKVRIITGDYDSKVMSKAHVTDDERKEGFVLACRVYPKSDMTVISASPFPKKQPKSS